MDIVSIFYCIFQRRTTFKHISHSQSNWVTQLGGSSKIIMRFLCYHYYTATNLTVTLHAMLEVTFNLIAEFNIQVNNSIFSFHNGLFGFLDGRGT